MLATLDPSDPLPLYEQLASSVRREVGDGTLRGGDSLPSARSLAGALGINVHTVLRAYSILRDEGIVDLRQGRAPRVVEGAAADSALFHQALGAVVAHARRLGLSSDDAADHLRRAYPT